MNKLKLFIENFLVYGIGGVIGKIIPLLMVPIITRLLPDTSFYGISDLSNTIVSFGCAIANMGMYDAMYRMFFEKEELSFKKEICSTTFFFTLVMSTIISLLMVLCKDFLAKYVWGEQYTYLIYVVAMATFVGATNNIVSAPTRMQNKRKVYIFMNLLSPLLAYSISIPLLLKGYYIIALPLAAMISSLFSELFFWFINKEWFKLSHYKSMHLKPLLKIALPLLPNFLIYWVFNSSDRIMIANILGTGAEGIYSVGSKLGMASQLIYTAFAGGWQYFAFSTMNEDNQVESNSKVFEYLGIISYICTLGIFVISKPLYSILFTGEYVEGYIIAPYLFLAPLLQMLFQVLCNQFIVIKKTWPNVFILSIGAVVNFFLNMCLIPMIGIEGAAIATLSGYALTVIICLIVLIKLKLATLKRRFVVSTTIMIGFILLWRMCLIDSFLISIIIALVCATAMAALYKEDVIYMFNQIKGKKGV